MDFKGVIISSILVGLFIFALISGGSWLAINNSANNTLMQNPSVNSTFGSIQTQLNSVHDTANNTKTSFETDIPIIKEAVALSSIVGNVKTYISLSINIIVLPFTLIKSILGIGDIVFGVISGIILISIILLAWSLYRRGA